MQVGPGLVGNGRNWHLGSLWVLRVAAFGCRVLFSVALLLVWVAPASSASFSVRTDRLINRLLSLGVVIDRLERVAPGLNELHTTWA